MAALELGQEAFEAWWCVRGATQQRHSRKGLKISDDTEALEEGTVALSVGREICVCRR